MRIDVWSDIVCPWCYIGKRRLERALASLEDREPVQVFFRSFQLNPSAPRDHTTDRAQGLKAKYGWSQLELQAMDARLLAIARDEGLEFRLDDQVTGNTFDAHRVAQMARHHGRQDAVVERLFRAYFVDGRSIFDRASLASLAAEAGLDAALVQSVLAGDAYADVVAADLQEAASLGVRGVPFFVLDGRYAISGAQPADVLRQGLERARGEVTHR
jgi:predicted DsbA family dithiol-disulfide isomerase